MNQIALITRHAWLKGRPVFEVPVIETEKCIGPRCPVGGGSFFYSPDMTRCAVIATKTAASYLGQRSYAKYLGIAGYSPDGINHYGWQPKDQNLKS